jgi:uncharacterized membrane-anchored protein
MNFTKEELEFIIYAVDELHHERISDMEYEEIQVPVVEKLIEEAKKQGVKLPSWWKQ